MKKWGPILGSILHRGLVKQVFLLFVSQISGMSFLSICIFEWDSRGEVAIRCLKVLKVGSQDSDYMVYTPKVVKIEVPNLLILGP